MRESQRLKRKKDLSSQGRKLVEFMPIEFRTFNTILEINEGNNQRILKNKNRLRLR